MKMTTIKSLAAVSLAAITSFGAYAGWGNMESPGILIDDARMYDVEMAPASDGSMYIVWTNWSEAGASRGFTLHAQLLDANGNKKWGEDGVLVDDHITPTWCSNWNILVTPTDELVISWADARSEENADVESFQAQNPVLYKLDKTGKMLWGEEGVVFDIEKYMFPAMLFQVEDNIYARFYGKEDSDPTQLMLLNEFGEPAWKDGKNFTGQIIASEGDDFLAVYPTSDGVMAMRYNKDMRQRWKAPALVSEKLYGGYDLNPYLLRSDGKGGMAVCYLTPLGDFGHMPVVAYVTGDGETAFSENVADTDMFDHLYPVMNINPEEETIMTVWQMSGMGNANQCLQGAQMDFFGERMWGDLGKQLAFKEDPAWSFGPVAVEPLEGGDWIVCYANEAGWLDNQLLLGRLDSEGKAVWVKNVGGYGPIISPKVVKRGDEMDIFWVEDNDYVDDEGLDRQCKSIMGVRIARISDVAGVDDVIPDMDNPHEEYYSIDGLRLPGLAKGLNIVRKADGSISKVMVK